MKHTRISIALAMGMAVTACSDDDSKKDSRSGDSGSDELKEGPGAFADDYATSADFFTLMDGHVKGSSPHGSVQIWYSSNIESIIDSASFEAPVGTTSIKEFDMDSNGTLDGYAVMVKKEAGYDADNGDWYYEMRDPSGKVMQEPAPGKIADCISCHAAAKKTDYLAGTSLTGGTSAAPDSGSSQLQKGPGAFTADYASSEDFFTRMKALVKGSSPHGSVQIWYSANIESILDNASFVAPEGTASIKEFDMDSDGTLDGFAVMVKKEPGYDADNGDWYYEMRAPNGDVMSEPPPGKIADCISCHAAAKKTDYLAGTALN